jgi:hypothetical protein
MPRREQPGERGNIYNSELIYFLRASASNMIVGWEFNCVLKRRTALANSITVEHATD